MGNTKLIESKNPRVALVRAMRGRLLYKDGYFKGEFRGWKETRYFINTASEVVDALGPEWTVEPF